ncbi:hypothetical protein LINPERPRIM_LOCUS24493 [Linum perenne]
MSCRGSTSRPSNHTRKPSSGRAGGFRSRPTTRVPSACRITSRRRRYGRFQSATTTSTPSVSTSG